MSAIVQTSKGKLRGSEENGLAVFRGIPFAQPPTGPLRFRAPQPLDPWTGERDATEFGPISMQAPNEVLQSLFGRARKQPPLDEDCLYLNVWTPALDGARRPVMVWIHGGAFVIGAGSEPLYEGSALASRDVVLVTINYRLGALGFLYEPTFASAPGEACANFGLLDQVAALRWVRDEIAAFGGDPDNVTVFGESAGAMSIGSLMGSPLAAGLFDKAVLQSGAAHNALTAERARRTTAAFAKTLGVEELTGDLLRSLPAAEILNVQTAMEQQDREAMQEGWPALLRFTPVIDGQFLAEAPIQTIRAGLSKDVPVLIGTNRDEWKLFTAMFRSLREISEDGAARRVARLASRDADGERGRAILDVYRKERAARGEATDGYELLCAALTDCIFRVPADRLAEAQAKRQPRVFAYRFDWPSPVGNGALGACHALELPFVFGTQGLVGPFVGGGAEADTLAKAMGDAWVAFARNGDPSTDSLPWPRFEAEHQRTMILDRDCRMEELPREAERRCWDGIVP